MTRHAAVARLACAGMTGSLRPLESRRESTAINDVRRRRIGF